MLLDRTQARLDLFGLVGFYNPGNPDYPNLSPSLLESRSGRRVNEVHALIADIENIDQSVKNFSHYNYPDYDTAVRDDSGYTKGSKVVFSSVNYEYISNNPSTAATPDPGTDPLVWTVIDELSDYLIKVVYAGIDMMLDEWINAKKLRNKIKSIYDQILLYNGVANYRDLVNNADDFVGLRIRKKKGERSLATIVNKIGHQFSGAFTGLTIYIFHSSQQNAIATFDIDHNNARSSQWTTLTSDNILRYISDDYDAGGDFFIGYKQSQLEALGAQALKMDLHWQEPPCQCDSKWTEYYKQYSNFIDVVGFTINESALGPGDTLFDPDLVSISYTNNYGLNLNLSTKCDIGYFVAQEEDLFAEALNNSIGKKLLEGIAYNTRGGNQLANQLKAEAKKELFHSSGVWGTVHDKLEKSIKGLSFDLSGLGEHCFPCDDGGFDPIAGKVTLH